MSEYADLMADIVGTVDRMVDFYRFFAPVWPQHAQVRPISDSTAGSRFAATGRVGDGGKSAGGSHDHLLNQPPGRRPSWSPG